LDGLGFFGDPEQEYFRKDDQPIATIMEMTKVLRNIVLLLYSHFTAARSENRWKTMKLTERLPML
jgi:hypothetical protein